MAGSVVLPTLVVFLPAGPAVADTWVAQVRPTLRPGSDSSEVLVVQRRLRVLEIPSGRSDGFYGDELRDAVLTFKAMNGLPPGSAVDHRTWAALAHPRVYRPFKPRGGGDRVEIGLRRQLLAVYRHGRLALVSRVSTGAGRPYCFHGHCGNAVTPRGNFRVYRKRNGWRMGPLGAMYRPLYVHGGIAMHGSAQVPLRPASHGCVRIPMSAADLVYRLVAKGTRVYIR